MGFLEKIFGNYSEKEIKKIKPIVAKIEALGPQYENLSDEELRGKTQEFKDRLAKGETLDDILPEAYAVVREAASRPNAEYEAFSRTADGRHRDASGTYCRDENR